MSFAVMMAAATAVSAAGQYAQGQATASAYEASAKSAEASAEAQRRKGAYEAGQIRSEGQSVLSTQRARYGASGVAMSGSPLEVSLNTVKGNEMDALMTMYNAEVNAVGMENQASIYRSQASNAKTAATIGAVGTLLSGAANMGMAQGNLGMTATTAPASAMGQPDPFRWRIPGWN